MQKKLIALAIAGLSSAAFAQSNVTVYGVVAVGQESVKASGATTAGNDVLSRGRLSNNSSLIGFKGTESLGNGMSAVFQVETTVTADTAGGAAGAITGSGRDTFVGLTGGFGTVIGGNLTHPMRALGSKVDNNPGAAGIGFTGSMYGQLSVNGLASIKTGTDERAGNAIAYVSPNFGGFTGTVAYVNGETSTVADGKGKAWQVAAQYENGPLFVGAAHHNADDAASLATAGLLDTNTKFKANRIAATYTFGGATKLSALWDSQKADLLPGDIKRNSWMLGASHTMGANQVYVQYAKAKNPTGSAVNAGNDSSAKQATIGYVYNMSKRTLVHAYYSKLSNAANGTYDFHNNAVGVGATGDGADPVGYGVGLRHSF